MSRQAMIVAALVLLAIVAAVLASGVSSAGVVWTEATLAAEAVPTNPGFVLLTENVDDPLPGTPFDVNFFSARGGRIVASMSELMAVAHRDRCVIGIAFHVTDEVDWDWVRSRYERGAVIAGVGINVEKLHRLISPSRTPAMESRGESWSDVLSLYGTYSPERWPTSYMTLQLQGDRGHDSGGQITLWHPEFGWNTQWVERLELECNAIEKGDSDFTLAIDRD